MAEQITVLAVDDQPANLRLLEAVLTPRGYDIRTAGSGAEALDVLAKEDVDLVLLDIVMPGMDGYQVCRAIRADERLSFLPVVMITASGDQERLRALEAGADDFVAKPFDQAELLARVASLARVKRYHDTVRRQAAELAEWNAKLADRVRSQVEELDRLGRLRRFLSPQLAELVVDAGDDSFLRSHRREIVVVFCDLRGFTPFAEASEPEEVMEVLGTYHRELGELIHRFEGTLERFTGDGLMVFFNDPLPCPDARGPGDQDGRRDARTGPCPGTGLGRGRPPALARDRRRAGVRHARADRLRGPLRLRRHRQRHEPGGQAVRRGKALAGSRHPSGPRGRRQRPRGQSARRPAAPRVQPPLPRVRRPVR